MNMKKAKTTPLQYFGDDALLVQGWGEPYVFFDGQCHILSMKDAEKMIKKFFTGYFKNQFDIDLSHKGTLPLQRGQYRIGDIQVQEDEIKFFKVEFHDGEKMFCFEFFIKLFCRGVAYREVFNIVEGILRGDYEQPGEWSYIEFLSWRVLLSQDIQNEIKETVNFAISLSEMDSVRSKFPKWFWNHYKKSIFWGNKTFNENCFSETLNCPLVDGSIKTYIGKGYAQQLARIDATMQAARDFEFFKCKG